MDVHKSAHFDEGASTFNYAESSAGVLSSPKIQRWTETVRSSLHYDRDIHERSPSEGNTSDFYKSVSVIEDSPPTIPLC